MSPGVMLPLCDALSYTFNRCHVTFPCCSATLPTNGLGPDQTLPFWVIGNEAGFFPSAVNRTQLLLGPAERYDILFDFGTLAGTDVYLLNAGPNAPYNGFNDWQDGLTLNQAQVNKASRCNYLASFSQAPCTALVSCLPQGIARMCTLTTLWSVT